MVMCADCHCATAACGGAASRTSCGVRRRGQCGLRVVCLLQHHAAMAAVACARQAAKHGSYGGMAVSRRSGSSARLEPAFRRPTRSPACAGCTEMTACTVSCCASCCLGVRCVALLERVTGSLSDTGLLKGTTSAAVRCCAVLAREFKGCSNDSLLLWRWREALAT